MSKRRGKYCPEEVNIQTSKLADETPVSKTVKQSITEYESPANVGEVLRMASDESDFSEFEEEQDDEGRLKKMEREVGFFKQMMDDVFKMQEQLSKENGDLKKKCEECEAEIGVIKNENKALRAKCKDYEEAIHDMRVKLDEGAG